MEQAVETLREATLLLDESAWRGAQNRAYYAMFYAVLALLATRQLGSSHRRVPPSYRARCSEIASHRYPTACSSNSSV
ncbi:MAG TPA: HEPN domain-containing protein [Thermoanaerobaculia bacterium]|nr:HEPN domain-containing protein [Thermoanaerobaculia bacterium]